MLRYYENLLIDSGNFLLKKAIKAIKVHNNPLKHTLQAFHGILLREDFLSIEWAILS